MSTNGAPVVRLDHGVVATNDLGLSIVFLTQVLGADFRRLVNANLRGLNREVPEMAFFKLANHHGFGYALQGQPIPKPIRPMEGPVWGLELNERSVEEAAELLREHDVPVEGPVEYPASSPIAGSLWLTEPGEYVFELSVRREDQRCSDPGQGYLGLCRLSHVRLEVTDLAQAEDWYRNTLGLGGRRPGTGRRPVDAGHRRDRASSSSCARGAGDDPAEPLLARPARGREGGRRRLRRVRVAAHQRRALLGSFRETASLGTSRTCRPSISTTHSATVCRWARTGGTRIED